jgi:pimeloyl-ACP methyl ester carboxylesterase/DNA-binding CsgD family transcriptional regulator
MEQQIRFCISPDGTRIAYATSGTGSPLVKVPNWMSHLEFDWHSPVWRHWWTELSRHYTLIRSDLRGCGLSDWNVEDMSRATRLQDLETVINALDLDRFALLALSGGGPTAIAYAVRHPEKVSHLVLYGTYARGRLKRDLTPEQIEEAQTYRQVIQVGWGKANAAFRQVYTSLFLPDGTPEQIHWFNDLQRISTSPDIAVRIMSSDWSDDVSDLACQVAVPTLVLHAQADAAVPFEEGRRLAALISGAQFVPLDSKNHVLLESEPAWQHFLAEIRTFLGTGASAPATSPRAVFPELSDRECEVLDLIAQGLSNSEIAQHLVISPKTVRNHITSIFGKLDVTNRAQAIVRAREAGLGHSYKRRP